MAASHRWETVGLVLHGTCPYWISTCAQLPNLETFSLQFYGHEEFPIQGYIPVVSNSPCLWKFSLSLYNVKSEARHYRMVLRPFLVASTQLSEIFAYFQTLNIYEFNDLLALQPDLKNLQLCRITGGMAAPINIVPHSSLSELYLYSLDSDTSSTPQFDGLILPNLTRFCLSSLPPVAGQSLIHYLVATAKDRLRVIVCDG
ncbi:hypothetical protein DL96DRAFT_1288908 [Flagelloscypha sp. PMI_526]|nr:hypothetical protein DL96DRAFT_1288908 [Flagelloscypha sp. PMI_526]